MLTLRVSPRPWAAAGTDASIPPSRYDCYCGVCLNLDVDAAMSVYGGREDLYHEADGWWSCWTTLTEIQESCKNGCPSCCVLQEGMRNVLGSHVETSGPETRACINFKKGNVLKLFLGDGESGRVLEFFTPVERSCPWDTIGSTMTFPSDAGYAWEGGNVRNVPADSGSQQCFQMIRSRLEQCERHHELCQKAAHGHLTTRVISVGCKDDFSDIHLYESQAEQEQYIALSHCWGRPQHLVTKHDSLAERKKSIAWVEMPRTFQDAVRITRKLGQKYLWIDSLCIIQDDKNDWERESAKMASIYQDAYLVIAATSGIDGDAGCFGDRLQAHVIPGTDETGKNFEILAREPRGHRIFGWNTALYMEFGGNDQRRHVADISWASHRHPLMTDRLRKRRGDAIFLFQRFSSNATGPLETLLTYWRYVVSEYSQRKLTYDNDVLPALSGLASRMVNEQTGRYLAGLWEHDLLRGMVWSAYGEEKELGSEYLAPSWSWASTRRSIDWALGASEIEFHLKILESDCTVPGLDRYGRIGSGYLRLTGCLIEGKIPGNIPTASDESCFIEWNGNKNPFRPDRIYKLQKGKSGCVYCLRLCTLLHEDSKFERTLVLRKLAHNDEVYERLGLMVNNHADRWDNCGDTKEITII
ncbi:HET-domain-containing protein [Rhizodiscina lignyota]|uniref:HET-domain-containing protein n=1 Tax=Rhizodiscina lignyota TaxID=1504668 RepID=A0A9P4ISA3_9PEZI|nr:HET-domain-containing protein [Rhizodiscina lignyota]